MHLTGREASLFPQLSGGLLPKIFGGFEKMFGVWDEIETKTVYRWLMGVVWMPFILFGMCFITLFSGLEVNSYTIPLSLLVGVPLGFLNFSPYWVKINGVMICPVFAGFTLGILVLMAVAISLYGVGLFYTGFIRVFRNVEGYEFFGSVRRRINSVVVHGSSRDKKMFALNVTAHITFAFGFVTVLVYLLDMLSLLETMLVAVPIFAFSLISGYMSDKYLNERIVPPHIKNKRRVREL